MSWLHIVHQNILFDRKSLFSTKWKFEQFCQFLVRDQNPEYGKLSTVVAREAVQALLGLSSIMVSRKEELLQLSCVASVQYGGTIQKRGEMPGCFGGTS